MFLIYSINSEVIKQTTKNEENKQQQAKLRLSCF